MYLKYALLIFFLNTFPLAAQHTFIGIRESIGFYSMKGLKELQEIRLEGTPGFSLKTTENYPPTLIHHFEAGQYLNKFISKWGIFYSFCSTGARSTVSDYSGRFDLDAIIIGQTLGFSLEHDISLNNNWRTIPYFEAGAIYTELNILDFFNLVGAVSKTYKIEYDLIAFGGFAEAGISLNYKYKFLSAAFKLGYMNDISAVFHQKGFKERQFYLGNKKVKPGWDGFRAGLQINILFKNKQKSTL